MSTKLPEVLPRFDLVVHCRDDRLARCIERCLSQGDCECRGWVRPPYAELRVPESMRHPWSPRLQLTFDEHTKGTRVRGVFRPEPGLWTGFVFLHSLLGLAAIVGIAVGLSQWTLGQPPAGMLALPVAGTLSLTLYLGAVVGQKAGHEEMCMLRRELDRALGWIDPEHDEWDPTASAEFEGRCDKS
jgi:hypothetical protein